MNLKVIVVSLTAGILLFTGYLASFKYLKLASEPVFCTQEAKQCPDGSAVGRTGPNCEFAECLNIGTSDVPKFDVSGWQTYRNEKYGFLVKYPSNWSIKNLLENNPQLQGGDLLEFLGFGETTLSVKNSNLVHEVERITSNSRGNQNYKLGEVVDILISGVKGKKIVILGLNGAPDVISVVVEYSGHAFIFNDQGSVSDSFLQILSTFKFIK